MTPSTTHIQHRELRAPRENGSALIEPPFAQIGGVVAENVELRSQHHYDFQGRSLAQLSRQARRELVCEAKHWTLAYRDVELPPCDTELVFLAGHQPQLFHPGVWWKNFALHYLASQHRAWGINLLIDSDTIKSTALRVPAGSAADPHAVSIPFDKPGKPIPYEERRIANRPLFADFGRRALEQIAPLVPDPLLRRYWPLVVERARQTDNLGACLAQSRHQIEGRWGLTTLEVPQSRICQSESFAWLVAHLLAHLPRLRAAYNLAVHEYRQANAIRNPAHPVPDLAADDGWLEAPFWVWTASDPQRRPLFARQRGNELLISNRHNLEIALPLTPEQDAARAVSRLRELSGRGTKIRSRALMTTLWARLALGDLFLHGIGGAKYDQVTDILMERFFGLKPPGIMVVSATLLLPVPRSEASAEEVREIRQRLRELTYHPERFTNPADQSPDGEGPAELIAAKAAALGTPQTAAAARNRHQEIRRANEALQPWVAQPREQLLARQEQVLRLLRADRVLSWREYSLCLYPDETLQDFLFGLLPKGEGLGERG